MKGICGFTREIIVGMVANLESGQLRRKEYLMQQLSPEHPRASATDDVEGMFSFLHEILGNIFDPKQFHDAQAKILNEFSKRIDPDLKFYYWTGAKHRYNEFDLPSFNRPTKEGAIEGWIKLDCLAEETLAYFWPTEHRFRRKDSTCTISSSTSRALATHNID